jgi:hypothetical protein
VSTKELYTFKMMQKANAAHLEFSPTPVDRKILEVLFQMILVIVVVARLR